MEDKGSKDEGCSYWLRFQGRPTMGNETGTEPEVTKEEGKT